MPASLFFLPESQDLLGVFFVADRGSWVLSHVNVSRITIYAMSHNVSVACDEKNSKLKLCFAKHMILKKVL